MSSYEIEVKDGMVTVWGSLPVMELSQIVSMYYSQGYDLVHIGHENSTLCLGKSPVDIKEFS